MLFFRVINSVMVGFCIAKPRAAHGVRSVEPVGRLQRALDPTGWGAGAFKRPPSSFAPFIDARSFTAAARAYSQQCETSQASAAEGFSAFSARSFAHVLATSATVGGRRAPSCLAVTADAPALGARREHQERRQRIADAWRRLDDAQRRLQRLWSDALRRPRGAFVSRLGVPTAPLTPEAAAARSTTRGSTAPRRPTPQGPQRAVLRRAGGFVNASSHWRVKRSVRRTLGQAARSVPRAAEINTLIERVRCSRSSCSAMKRGRKPRTHTRTRTRPSATRPRAKGKR